VPRVSIIIPAYNALHFLERAVNSVLNQTVSDWELIIINDGSLDDTGELCEQLKQKDDRIFVYHQENAGVSAARNNGISRAKGELIAFLDADDWYAPNFLEKMLDTLESTGTDSVCCGHFNAQSETLLNYEAPPLSAGTHTEEEIRTELVFPLLCDRISANLINGYIWRFLFSRKTIIENGIEFNGAYLEDELFLIEYYSCPGTLSVVDEGLYYYYQNSLSVTKRYQSRYLRTFFNSLDWKRELIERYAISVPSWWVDNTCWAGLLIAVSNLFAPGNTMSFFTKIRNVREICRLQEFRHAIEHYKPSGLSKNKAIVATLIRCRLYFLLGILYVVKNRNR
jgi:glycosyltransferase EpsJ